jgi:hypothetical protein
VSKRARGQKDWMIVPQTREAKVETRWRRRRKVTGKESSTVSTGSTATKSSKGASSPYMRMKYLGKVASRWRKVARVPMATMSESPSSFLKGLEPHTTRSVVRRPCVARGQASSSA